MGDDPYIHFDPQDLDGFSPLNGYVLVEVDPPQEREGQIFLVGSVEKQRRSVKRGVVVKTSKFTASETGAVIETGLAEGDVVHLRAWAGHDIRSGGNYLVLAKYTDVLCVEVAA